LKIEGLLNRESIIAHKLKFFKIFYWLIIIEWFKAFHVYTTLENQFRIFVSKKVFLFICPDTPFIKKSNILGHNFWVIFPNVMKFSAHERYSLSPPSIGTLA